jgi:PilZ domain
MKPLRPGQDTVLSWSAGAIECRVVAAAGSFVLLRPDRSTGAVPMGTSSLTFLDGMVPMGWDGSVEPGGHPGELRFRVREGDEAADRRSAVRVPVFADVSVTTAAGDSSVGQLLDISAGGLRLRHRGGLEIGSLVRVRTTLADGLTVDADAVVRKTAPDVVSVEYTAMHAADGQAIGAWTVRILRASLSGQG